MARKEKKTNAYRVAVGKPVRHRLYDLSAYERIRLKLISEKRDDLD